MEFNSRLDDKITYGEYIISMTRRGNTLVQEFTQRNFFKLIVHFDLRRCIFFLIYNKYTPHKWTFYVHSENVL